LRGIEFVSLSVLMLNRWAAARKGRGGGSGCASAERGVRSGKRETEGAGGKRGRERVREECWGLWRKIVPSVGRKRWLPMCGRRDVECSNG